MILHVEATMTFPNALLLKPEALEGGPDRDAAAAVLRRWVFTQSTA